MACAGEMRKLLNQTQKSKNRKENAMTNELNTYTMQDLYKQPLEPVEYLVDGLLAPGCI